MDKNKMERQSLFVLFIGISALAFFVFAPFLKAIALAVVFAIFLDTPYEKLKKALGGWQSGAALTTVLVMLVFCIAPLFFLGVRVSQEAQGLYIGMQGGDTEQIHALEKVVAAPLQKLFPGFVFNINTYVGNALISISNSLGSLIYQTLYILFITFLMLLALFFFLRDGRSLLASLRKMSPLGEGVMNDILHKMYQTIRSVVRGTLLIILIRFACIWITFCLFDIPNALLWSSVGGVIGAIPGLGTPIAFIGVGIYLYLQGSFMGVLGSVMFGIATTILVDNILTSYFFGKGLEVPSIFVLFSILGGILLFGPLGFIFGPLVLSVFLSIIRVYGLAVRE